MPTSMGAAWAGGLGSQVVALPPQLLCPQGPTGESCSHSMSSPIPGTELNPDPSNPPRSRHFGAGVCQGCSGLSGVSWGCPSHPARRVVLQFLILLPACHSRHSGHRQGSHEHTSSQQPGKPPALGAVVVMSAWLLTKPCQGWRFRGCQVALAREQLTPGSCGGQTPQRCWSWAGVWSRPSLWLSHCRQSLLGKGHPQWFGGAKH